MRLLQRAPVTRFHDLLSGEIRADERLAREDFIIHRRDGLFAYNTAVVVDDHFERHGNCAWGRLVEPTVRQISLYQQFGWKVPGYLHLPLAVNAQGIKLSKQNHAPALPDGDPRPVLIDALRFLNQNVTHEWQDLRIDELLKMAIAQWTLTAVPKIQHSQMRCAEL